MKIISILATLLAMSSFASAQEQTTLQIENTAVAPAESATPTTTAKTPEVATEKTEASWTISLGLSQFNNSVADFKGSGITIEAQRKFGRSFFFGASYTNYNTEQNTVNYDPATGTTSTISSTKDQLDVLGISTELHPVQLALPLNSEFFAAVNAGVLGISGNMGEYNYNNNTDVFYGIGVGLNYNNQIGIRSDIKTSRDLRTIATVALVGYY